jgi:hypothetical protein
MIKKNHIIVASAVVIGASLLLFPIVSRLREPRAPRVECLMRLNQLGLLGAAYQSDHGGRAPTNMTALMTCGPEYLRPEYETTQACFVCPATGHVPGRPEQVDEWTDYKVFTNDAGTNLDVPFAYCRPENHHGVGGSILFRDGSIEWYSPEEFSDVIQKGRKPSPTTAPNVRR